MLNKVRLTDITLRHGSSVLNPRNLGAVRLFAESLVSAGVEAVEINDLEWIEAVAPELAGVSVATLVRPDRTTLDELRLAYRLGARSIRVAAPCGEAHLVGELIEGARNLELAATAMLSRVQTRTASEVAQEAKVMQSLGANTVYIVDSDGVLTMSEIADRVRAVRQVLESNTMVGVDTRAAVSGGLAHSIAAINAGCNWVDIVSTNARSRLGLCLPPDPSGRSAAFASS